MRRGAGIPIVFVLVVLATPLFLAPAATQAFLTDANIWAWVEHVSWVVTVVRLGIGLYQLKSLSIATSYRPTDRHDH